MYVSCLGSRTLSQVRVQFIPPPCDGHALSDACTKSTGRVIYKRGQAGVTRASVTVVIDNSDRERSPVRVEDLKQNTVTCQVRYWVGTCT